MLLGILAGMYGFSITNWLYRLYGSLFITKTLDIKRIIGNPKSGINEGLWKPPQLTYKTPLFGESKRWLNFDFVTSLPKYWWAIFDSLSFVGKCPLTFY